jgi:hypothetical protein
MVFCLVYAATTCETVEIVPASGDEVTEMSCMMGGMMGSSAPFLYGNEWWILKGVRCARTESDVMQWLQSKKDKQ